jgi:PHD/YefM family antitoxin component YafN of YafNO toxin-antitoxin module
MLKYTYSSPQQPPRNLISRDEYNFLSNQIRIQLRYLETEQEYSTTFMSQDLALEKLTTNKNITTKQ